MLLPCGRPTVIFTHLGPLQGIECFSFLLLPPHNQISIRLQVGTLTNLGCRFVPIERMTHLCLQGSAGHLSSSVNRHVTICRNLLDSDTSLHLQKTKPFGLCMTCVSYWDHWTYSAPRCTYDLGKPWVGTCFVSNDHHHITSP